MKSIKEILVCIPTYKRPETLEKLLGSLSSDKYLHEFAEILVIDNDLNHSARPTVDKFSEVGYLEEKVPGVSAVRTKALRAAKLHKYLAFIDDDELPSDAWLRTLHTVIKATGADAVGGPVDFILPNNAPSWIRRGNFFDSRCIPDGFTAELLATNNCMVRLEFLIDKNILEFDPEFGTTGGEDSAFFHKMLDAGADFFWSNEARVIEHVVESRLTLGWISRRYIQNGITHARLMLKSRSRKRVFVEGIARLVSGFLLSVPGLAFRGTLFSIGLRRLMRGIGFCLAAAAVYTHEYNHKI